MISKKATSNEIVNKTIKSKYTLIKEDLIFIGKYYSIKLISPSGGMYLITYRQRKYESLLNYLIGYK